MGKDLIELEFVILLYSIQDYQSKCKHTLFVSCLCNSKRCFGCVYFNDEPLTKTYLKTTVNMCVTVFSKILEKVMDIHLLDHIAKSNILHKYQFGFRKQHSKNTNIILTLLGHYN